MFAFPEWLQNFQVNDDKFAEAYESIQPQLRAWLKKTIAQVYAVNSPEAARNTWTVNTWRGGFETEISSSPLDWTMLLLDKGTVSPVRVLAALSPALAVGVKNILVVHVGDGDIKQSMLTAFELAGQEDVVRLDEEKLTDLMDFFENSNFPGAVVDLRFAPKDISFCEGIRYWRAPNISSICICKDDELPDMDVLKFAHPDVDFVDVDEESLENTNGDAVVVPAELVGDALTGFKIVLAHGQEGCWIWNGFDRLFFRQESVALAVAE